MSLKLYSEPYRASGNIDARASRRALSQSESLGGWDLLLRETLQNSWDARIERAGGGVHFRVETWFPSESQQACLRDYVFSEVPPEEALGDEPGPLDDDYPVLVITDWGTRGLAGPTRADLAQTGDVDFVDFVRNVGRASQKELGGGTFGFGKGVLYETSICSTIVVFTRTHDAGRPVSRLMAIRLGSSFDAAGKRFTGRHWWGLPDDRTGSEPLVGAEAERIAATLGLDGIPDGATGTALMIIGPVAKSEDETTYQVVDSLRTAALFWAWPHMIGGAPSINFTFACDGVPLPSVDPQSHPVLRDFVSCYARARDLIAGDVPQPGYQWTDAVLRGGKGAKPLGTLTVRRRLPGEIPHGADGEPSVDNHVALMREPRFVVRYRPAPPDAAGRTIAGVFVAEKNLDGEFALAEPPAHDDWIPGNLQLAKHAHNPVRQALAKLTEALRPPRARAATVESAALSGGLVHLAGSLGSLLDGQPGGVDARTPSLGASNSPSAKGGSDGRGAGSDSAGMGAHSGRRRASTMGARVTSVPTLMIWSGRPVAVFPVEITRGPEARVFVSATPHVVIDGGTERPGEGPLGAPVPKLLGWSTTGAVTPDPSLGRSDLTVEAEDTTAAWAWVSQPADTAVGLTVKCLRDAP